MLPLDTPIPFLLRLGCAGEGKAVLGGLFVPEGSHGTQEFGRADQRTDHEGKRARGGFRSLPSPRSVFRVREETSTDERHAPMSGHGEGLRVDESVAVCLRGERPPTRTHYHGGHEIQVIEVIRVKAKLGRPPLT